MAKSPNPAPVNQTNEEIFDALVGSPLERKKMFFNQGSFVPRGKEETVHFSQVKFTNWKGAGSPRCHSISAGCARAIVEAMDEHGEAKVLAAIRFLAKTYVPQR